MVSKMASIVKGSLSIHLYHKIMLHHIHYIYYYILTAQTCFNEPFVVVGMGVGRKQFIYIQHSAFKSVVSSPNTYEVDMCFT